jgi:hypothetical protein
MPHANNRAAARPQASFRVAGGLSVLFRHPFLSGQISGASPVDEIDITKALRLNDTFLNAVPLINSSVTELLVDGSTITITNHASAGRMTLQVLETTGFVGTGDFIAALHLIRASKDSIGGTLTVIRWFNGRKRIRVYTGVSAESVPDEIIAGNALAPYPVVLTYGAWFEGAGAESLGTRTIWAVGNKYGLKGVYKPYAVQKAEGNEDGGTAKDYFDGSPAASAIGGEGGGEAVDNGDVVDSIVATNATHPSVTPDADDPNPTWPAADAPEESDEAVPPESGND